MGTPTATVSSWLGVLSHLHYCCLAARSRAARAECCGGMFFSYLTLPTDALLMSPSGHKLLQIRFLLGVAQVEALFPIALEKLEFFETLLPFENARSEAGAETAPRSEVLTATPQPLQIGRRLIRVASALPPSLNPAKVSISLSISLPVRAAKRRVAEHPAPPHHGLPELLHIRGELAENRRPVRTTFSLRFIVLRQMLPTNAGGITGIRKNITRHEFFIFISLRRR